MIRKSTHWRHILPNWLEIDNEGDGHLQFVKRKKSLSQRGNILWINLFRFAFIKLTLLSCHLELPSDDDWNKQRNCSRIPRRETFGRVSSTWLKREQILQWSFVFQWNRKIDWWWKFPWNWQAKTFWAAQTVDPKSSPRDGRGNRKPLHSYERSN